MTASSAITTISLFRNESRLPEIEDLVVGYLDSPGRRSLMQTCRIARNVLRESCLKASLQSKLFDSAKWFQFFELEVESCCDADQLPIKTVSEILRARKDANDAIAFVLPKGVTLAILREKTRTSQLPLKFTPAVERSDVMNRAVERTCVVLVDVYPAAGSEDKNYDEQCKIVKELSAKHEVPSSVELATCALVARYTKRVTLFTDQWVRSIDAVREKPIGLKVFLQPVIHGGEADHLWVEDLGRYVWSATHDTYDMVALQRFYGDPVKLQ